MCEGRFSSCSHPCRLTWLLLSTTPSCARSMPSTSTATLLLCRCPSALFVWPRVQLRVTLSSQFLECLVVVSTKMEKSDVVSQAVKVRPPPSPTPIYRPPSILTCVQVEALMRALTGETGGSRPSTRHSKASNGAAGEGATRAHAARLKSLM